MNEHNATEIAYKNGYKRGALDVLEEIEQTMMNPIWSQNSKELYFYELKRKYEEGPRL